MTLASANNNQPWVCTVYYVDDEKGLYFVTSKTTRHAQEIMKNPLVAVSIFDSLQLVTDDKEGFQATGKVKMLTNIEEIGNALQLWQKRNPGAEEHINLEYVSGNGSKSTIFCVELDYVKHMNGNIYGEADYGEWKNE